MPSSKGVDIAITGATGLIGRSLAETLRSEGHAVRSVSVRNPPHTEDIDGCRAIINLAGDPVAQRWTSEAQDRIRNSRVEGTRWLVDAMGKLSQPPEVLVSASAVGYYGSRADEILTESSLPANDFLAQVCIAWEREAQRAETVGVRVVRLRTAMVLARKDGALGRMLLPFRLGIGGRIGDGKQWMSWIHIEDLIGLISFALATVSLKGAVNASAPNPVANAEFTRELARVLHRPAIFPIPRVALHLLYGEMASVVYASQRVIPEAAVQAGFRFRFPRVGAALNDLL